MTFYSGSITASMRMGKSLASECPIWTLSSESSAVLRWLCMPATGSTPDDGSWPIVNITLACRAQISATATATDRDILRFVTRGGLRKGSRATRLFRQRRKFRRLLISWPVGHVLEHGPPFIRAVGRASAHLRTRGDAGVFLAGPRG